MRRISNYIISISFLFIACSPAEEATPVSDCSASFVCENEILAGSELRIDVHTQDSENLLLSFEGIWGSYTFKWETWKGSKEFLIPSKYTEIAGEAYLRLICNDQIVHSQEVGIIPGESKHPIKTYTGPKSIWNQSKQRTMLVAIPRDTFGNVVEEGSVTKHNYNFPKQNIEKVKREVEDMVSYTRVVSPLQSGNILASVSDPKGSSAEQDIKVLASWPYRVELILVDHIPYADDRHYVEFKTNKLTDRIGAQIPDGTLVSLEISSDKGTYSVYKSLSIDGVAKFQIRNPSYKTFWKAKANIGNRVNSNTLKLYFDSPLKRIEYTYHSDKNQLEVGPLRSFLNQNLTDGMKVFLEIEDQILSSQTVKGSAWFDLGKLNVDPGEIPIKIMVSDKSLTSKIEMD